MNNKTDKNKKISLDWLIAGVLTRVGDIFDSFTGRRWKPSSSLATSELSEKLKILLDSKIRETENNGKFVPHNIQLKMQWDKFSTDSEDSMEKLENELLITAVDHINNNRYHTFAPLNLEIKPDYFTDGVKLLANFGTNDENNSAAEINVTVPDLKDVVIEPEVEILPEPKAEIYIAKFKIKDKQRETELTFGKNSRKTVGRSGANDLWLDDESVSKVHAALIAGENGSLIISDTGSTNGTFLSDERIAYGKAVQVVPGDNVKFGSIEVEFTYVPLEEDFEFREDEINSPNETDKFEMSNKNQPKILADSKQLPVAQTIIIKPEMTAPTEVLNNKDFKIEEISEAKIEMPKDLPFEEKTNEKSIYDTNVDDENETNNEYPATEQEIFLDFDPDKK